MTLLKGMVANTYRKLREDVVVTRVGRNSAIPVEIVITLCIVINLVVSKEVEEP